MYDYVIIGGGSAGCVLANRLTENPDVRVLLLEAGGQDKKPEIQVPAAFSKLFRSEVDWAYYTQPQPYMNERKLYWPRGRVLGGSSAINAMIYMRGSRTNYDHWASLGNIGWGFEDVLPYFKRAEDFAGGASAYHGAGGPMRVESLRDPRPLSLAFLEATQQAGISSNPDFNASEQDGAGLYHVTMRRGMRESAASAYLKPALKRPNLTVQTESRVLRLVHNGERFAGVEFIQGRVVQQVDATREILLCAGAINTPQILMLSGVGSADHLQDLGIDLLLHLPGVGKNLQDHLVAGVIMASRQPLSLVDAETLGNLLKYVVGRVGPLTSNIAEAGAYVRLGDNLAAPNIQYHFAPNFFVNHGFDNPPGHGFSLGPVLVSPQSHGEITLASTDPLAPPHIQPNYLSVEADMEALLDGVKLARKIIDQPAFDAYRGEEYLPGSDVQSDDDLREHIRNTSETLYHPVGTCKMGTDENAVVDANLRIRGARGVRVVDASVMPVIPNGNTNAPTIMIAEKAADLIKTQA